MPAAASCRRVVVQVEFESKIWKPGFHLIDSRFETRRLQAIDKLRSTCTAPPPARLLHTVPQQHGAQRALLVHAELQQRATVHLVPVRQLQQPQRLHQLPVVVPGLRRPELTAQAQPAPLPAAAAASAATASVSPAATTMKMKRGSRAPRQPEAAAAAAGTTAAAAAAAACCRCCCWCCSAAMARCSSAPGAEDGLARHADVGRRGHSGLQARDDGFVLERSLHHLCVGYPRRDVVGGGGQVLLCGEEEKRRRTRRRRDAAVVVFRRVCNV